jgi:hypothetical protein
MNLTASPQRPARGDDAQPDEDGETEHGAGALAPRSSTIPEVPLQTAPDPAPISAPEIRNIARLGVGRRTETTSRTRPVSMQIVPSASTRDAGS